MDCFGRFTYEGRLVVGGAWIDGKGWLGGEGVAMVRTFSNVRELFFFFFSLRFGGAAVLNLGGLQSFFCRMVSSGFEKERERERWFFVFFK